jgi:hypothetical protein
MYFSLVYNNTERNAVAVLTFVWCLMLLTFLQRHQAQTEVGREFTAVSIISII